MKNIFITLFFLIFALPASAQGDVIVDYWDTESPFDLIMPDTSDTLMEVHSNRYKKLLAWVKANPQGWKADDFAYSCRICLVQANLFFRYFQEGYLVAAFVDKDDNPKHYIIRTKPGELDFILER